MKLIKHNMKKIRRLGPMPSFLILQVFFCSSELGSQTSSSPSGHPSEFTVMVYGPDMFAPKDELAWWDQRCSFSSIVPDYDPNSGYGFNVTITEGTVTVTNASNRPPFVSGKLSVPDSLPPKVHTLKSVVVDSWGNKKTATKEIPWVESPLANVENSEPGKKLGPPEFGPEFLFTEEMTSVSRSYSSSSEWEVGGTVTGEVSFPVVKKAVATLGIELTSKYTWGNGEQTQLNVSGAPGETVGVLIFPIADVTSGPVSNVDHCGTKTDNGNWEQEDNPRLRYTTEKR